MKYSVKAQSHFHDNGTVLIKQSTIDFGTTADSADAMANPAELFLGSLAACILKSVERFSHFMKFEYSDAEITVSAIRLEKPPKIAEVRYLLNIHTDDSGLNIVLLQKNIEMHGTIYNTVASSCSISGAIELVLTG